MRTYILKRHKQTAYATYGKLFREDGTLVCVTIERPWVDLDKNGHRDRGVSRFVPGTYATFLRLSHLKKGGTGKRDYDVWELTNVPDTGNAQMHIANLPEDLEGCVGLGEAFADIENKHKDSPHFGKMMPGISGSTSAVQKFMKETAGLPGFLLKVEDHF